MKFKTCALHLVAPFNMVAHRWISSPHVSIIITIFGAEWCRREVCCCAPSLRMIHSHSLAYHRLCIRLWLPANKMPSKVCILFFGPKGQTEEWIVWPCYTTALSCLAVTTGASVCKLGRKHWQERWCANSHDFSHCVQVLRATRRPEVWLLIEGYVTAIGALEATFQ